ncbi:hypothetical protein [Hamadaea tsunoensis]|uniref:hypothetical protein n=1 Tax=Hamadaea tsunoensis TaxID=53368 RepID=UPI0012F8BC5F|nr:hypothetical protein [Hamadaea tsunoensis]
MSFGRHALGALAIAAISVTAAAPAASGHLPTAGTATGAAASNNEVASGAQWRLYDLPVQIGANLTGVATVARDDAWAVGFTIPAKTAAATAKPATAEADVCDATGLPSLALHWDGVAWSQVPVPNLGRVNAVSASGRRNAWAAADCGVLRWDGRTWTRTAPVPIQGAAGFYYSGIKAIGAYDVWLSGFAWDGATGDSHGFVQHWDGVRWRLVDLPAVGSAFDLSSIDAGGPQDVWVGGTDYTDKATAGERLLILHWNGYAWKRFPAPASTMVIQRVARVRVVAAADVWIAGMGQRDPDGWDIDRPLILHWNGTVWSDTHAAEERGDLRDIAADGRTVLAAGDTYSPLDDTFEAYVRRWTAGGWIPGAVPVSGLASISALAPIPDGGMWAVGAAGDPTALKPFIARTGR